MKCKNCEDLIVDMAVLGKTGEWAHNAEVHTNEGTCCSVCGCKNPEPTPRTKTGEMG